MPFVAEDGTGLANANSLATVEACDAYFADRAVTTWAAKPLAARQAALVNATDYIERRFASRFAGSVQFPEVPQALSFPRDTIEGVVPAGIVRATAEYALRTFAGPLAPDPVVDATGLTVATKKTVIGPIETTTSYQAGGVVSSIRAYPAADMLIAPFLRRATQGGVYR